MTVIYQGGAAMQLRKPPQIDVREAAATHVRNALLGGGDGQIREAIADYMHYIEDRTFNDLSMDPQQYITGQDFTPKQRKLMLASLRNIARSNPVAKEILRLICTYVFGSGIQVKSVNAADKQYVQPVIVRTWNDPYNQRTFASVSAQHDRCRELVRDGDMFFVAYVNTDTGMVRWGHIDAYYVEDIVTDPDDISIHRWYKVRRVVSTYDFRQGTYLGVNAADTQRLYYYLRDIDYEPEPGDEGPPADMIEDGVVLHKTVNKEGKFGVSDLYASRDWLTAHKGFMEDRASYTKALHNIAWMVTRKDTPKGIQAAAQAVRSTMAENPMGGWDLHPPVAAGSTLIQNEGTRREPMAVDTGANNAVHDAENLLQMAVIGGGIVGTHYVGSVQAHRLATVTQMELPMLKLFQWWQQFWKNTYSEMLQFCIDQAILAGVIPGDPTQMDDNGRTYAGVNTYDEDSMTISGSMVIDRSVSVEFPAILVKDLAGVVNAVRGMIDVLPLTVEARKLVASIAFSALGVEDVEDAVRRCFPEGGAVLLPANSTKNNIVKVLPSTGEDIDPDEEDASDDSDANAGAAWSGSDTSGQDSGKGDD